MLLAWPLILLMSNAVELVLIGVLAFLFFFSILILLGLEERANERGESLVRPWRVRSPVRHARCIDGVPATSIHRLASGEDEEEVLATLHLQVDGELPGEAGRRWRRERDRRLAELARSRVPLLVRDSVDRALAAAISALERVGDPSRVAAALEAGTSRGVLLPRRARARYRLAVGLLRDAAGHGDALELELDLGEAERLLWAVRWEVARGP